MDTNLIQINNRLAKEIQVELGQNVYLCYQCVKCTSGCPVGEFFDWQPNQVMRAIQLGQEDIALKSKTPWLCAACETCTTRCPQGLDINAIMEFLARESLRRGFPSPVGIVNQFNQATLREIRLWGRLYEPGLLAELVLHYPGIVIKDMDLYRRMLLKRKVGFFPQVAKPAKKGKRNPEAGQAIAYYPGCSLHSSAKEFDTSSREVCAALDIHLVEPKDWVCCGSSAAHKASPKEAFLLPMKNLNLIEQMGFDEVTMPCAACYNRHQSARFEINQDDEKRKLVQQTFDYDNQDHVRVTTLYEAILQHAGENTIRDRVQKPLSPLNLVCYYGCLLTRPPRVTRSAHPENPVDLDKVMLAAGAQVNDWSYKTTCCGAAHSLTRPDIVLKLSSKLVEEAARSGAEAIVVACPLCHLNLDARQFQMPIDKKLPILFFTQLLAVALGLPEKSACLDKNLTDPRPLLREKGLIH